MSIYFDNAATTKPCEESNRAMLKALNEKWGNPSSLHKMGIEAQEVAENSRKAIAAALGCESECVYFTSGATESNNTAVLGAAKAHGKRRRKIVTTSVEHPSVSEAMKLLEANGYEIVRVNARSDGEYCFEDFIDAVDDNTCLVSCMLVNNENGLIMPVKKAFNSIKRLYPHIITHTDAVQGFLKTPFKASELNADLISLSAHKIQGPKGVGALYIKKDVRISPHIIGGGQENKKRSGTENIPAIAGFGAAVRVNMANANENAAKAQELKSALFRSLMRLDGVSFNSGTEDSSPYIANFSVMGVRSEIMLHYLEEKDIFVSSGSACSKGAKSSVLKGFGLSDDRIDSALRVSFCAENTVGEVKVLCAAIADGIARFRKQ